MITFERHKDPKDSMNIGLTSIAIELSDVLKINVTSGSGKLLGAQVMKKKEIHEFLKGLDYNKEIITDKYRKKLKQKFKPRSLKRDQLSWDTLYGNPIKYDGKIYHV